LIRFVGLTGGIGAGKSEALAAFARLGAATLSTDQVTHELLADPEVRDALIERWGEEVAPDGEVDRGRVAEIVFADSGELAWLESQLHPRVGTHVLGWRERLESLTRETRSLARFLVRRSRGAALLARRRALAAEAERLAARVPHAVLAGDAT